MSDRRAAAFSERFFWPIAVLAFLALGGFVYFASLMFSSPYKNLPASTAGAPKAPPTPVVDVKMAAAPASEHKTETPKTVEPALPAAKNALETPTADPVPAADTDAPAIKKPDAPEVNPYMVPENKPFLSHDMFEKKPGPAKPAATNITAKPKVPGKPDDKPKPALATRTTESTPPSTSTPIPAFRGKIYVLRDGRRISTVSTVDLGDSYGVKDLNSSYLTIPKTDVAEVVNR